MEEHVLVVVDGVVVSRDETVTARVVEEINFTVSITNGQSPEPEITLPRVEVSRHPQGAD
ncbi:MAG: hypothetical protein V5A62_01430 [Haloarculaceae archaeon]